MLYWTGLLIAHKKKCLFGAYQKAFFKYLSQEFRSTRTSRFILKSNMSNFNIAKSLFTGGLSAALSLTGLGQKKGNELLDQFNAKLNQNQISFTENKGQVYDQNRQPRPDVLFGGENNGLIFHLRNNGISYQLNRIDKWKAENLNSRATKKDAKPKGVERSTVYRVDINWVNTNSKPAILKNKEFAGFESFYKSDEQLIAKSYAEVVYSDLYNGIDLKWYEKNGELKYDYICAAGADYKKITLQIEGAEKLTLNSKGELEISTPLGTIVEKAPVVIQSGKSLGSKWVLENNIISFSISNLNKSLPYIIDPAIRAWGTFYGGNSFDIANACATYTNGDVYMAGNTYLNTSTIIATSGSHQTTLGGMDDAFLVKFNSSGVRQWATYYGGADSDNGRSLAVDASGNVYMCGITSSTNGIATTGSHQSTIGGGSNPDGFLVKFNSSGVRQWATYYGGNSSDEFHQCSLDPSGNIYLSGTTDLATSTVIATAGTHQTAFGGGVVDAFLVKFNSSGVRQWGTYYGGTDIDFGYACTADANNVYLAGTTTSSNSAMVSTGCHQGTYGGSLYDGYLAKFSNSTGTRAWGTFYGGNSIDQGYSCAVDGAGNVYLSGVSSTSVANVIATAAAHQTVGATLGDDDAFLVKFSSAGVRLWATYYGGDDYDQGHDCKTDASNNVYLAGTTNATLSGVIATAASHQTVLGNTTGGSNAFLVKFNTSGVRQWGTYYGEDGEDASSCSLDGNGAIYMCGPAATTSSVYISTPGCHQPNPGGILDGYLVKFTDCSAQAPTNVTPPSNQAICATNSTTLSANSGTSTITWYTTATSTQVIGTGTNFITPTLSVGSYTYYAEASGCGGSSPRTGITVSVNPTPTVTAGSGTICAGQSFTVQPSGASTYTVFDNSGPLTGLVLSPVATTVYYVGGTDANGCISDFYVVQTHSITVTVNAGPVISVNSGTICGGTSFTLVPAGGVTYTFQGGSNVVSPVTTTNYTVLGADSQGCTGTATSSVTITAPPVVDVKSGTICLGSSFTITPNGFSTYTISGGNAIVSPTTTTNYTISGTSSGACPVAKTLVSNVKVNNPPRMPFPSTLTPYDFNSANNYLPSFSIGAYSFDLKPSTSLLTLNATTGLTINNYTSPAQLFTLTMSSAGCSASYTLLLTEAEDLSKYWVLPDFISPNGDFKNDDWLPSYKGINPLELTLASLAGNQVHAGLGGSPYQPLSNDAQVYTAGLKAIKVWRILDKSFKPIAEGTSENGLYWVVPSEISKEGKTYAFYYVEFKNGVIKAKVINIDKTSNQ